MIRIRRAALWALVFISCAMVGRAPEARAAAEIHKLNLLLSGNPSSLAATKYNDLIEQYNTNVLDPRGYEPLSSMHFGWLFQAEMRYFVRPNVTVDVGFGNVKSSQEKEFLPRISQSINIDTHIQSDVWNVGASYYLQPYNQGDFQARMYFSGGLLSLTNTQFKFGKVEAGTDSSTTLGTATGTGDKYSYNVQGKSEGPGWYIEGGAHMFFASRFSVMLGLMYRDMKVVAVPVALTEFDKYNNPYPSTVSIQPVEVDLSGVSARMGVCIGF